MAIKVVPAPAVLTWNLFTPVDSLTNGEDAHTDVNFGLAFANFKRTDGVYSLADTTLTVNPLVKVLKTANKTDDLLSHEQGHFNIGILVGRALGRELEGMSDKDPGKLKTAMTAAFDKHRLKLMPVVQKAYDDATEHSGNSGEQARWDTLISAALGSTTFVDKLNQLPL